MSFFGTLKGLISDTVAEIARLDASTHAMETIEYEHHEIHSGSSYTCHYTNTVTNIGEMTVIALNAPDTTKEIHLVVEFSSTAASYFAVYEATSIDVDEGTQLTVYNRNRNSANAATITSIETAPVANKATSYDETQAAGANITTTTELSRTYIGAGERKSVGGGGRGVSEWILDRAGQYAFMLVGTTADDCTHSLALDWYEHTPKD